MNDEVRVSEDTGLPMVAHDKAHNLYQRINAVQREVGYVQKDKNVDKKYDVATYDAVLGVLRAALVIHGIVVETRQVGSGRVVELGATSSSGRAWLRYEGDYLVRFVNVDNPEDTSEIPVTAHADDLGDKAPGKAQTYATKAVIKKQFLLETGDDEEGRAKVPGPDGSPPETEERQRPAAKPDAAAPAEKKAPPPPGKRASEGEVKFARGKLKTDENIAAFLVTDGVDKLEHCADGVGKRAGAFMAGR